MKLSLSLFLALFAGAGCADPFADMAGTWRGSGWARETPQSQKDSVRCQIKNTYSAESRTLELSGLCVIPGRRVTLSGRLVGEEGAERITGRWFNPDGLGSTNITGIQRSGVIAFTFNAKDPATGRNLAQNVEWRITQDRLQLRSSDRNAPNLMMSDITFHR